MEESAGGDEPPAFSDDEPEAQDEDSDDYSGLFDETVTDDQEEDIGWDTLGLPETQTTQMSLFDTDAFAQETQANGQPVSTLGIQYSQEIVDEALRIGANDPNSRLIICAYFMKDKPLEENVRFLKEHYKTNGAGFYFQDRPYSIWYDQDGILLSSGETAQGNLAHVISWKQAAVRIRELLDDAQYMTWDELTRVTDFELGELADSLVFLCRDIDEGGKKQNLLPSIKAIQSQRLTFPDERDAVMELLRQPGAKQVFALPHDAACPLLQVAGTPGTVQIVRRDQPVLHIRARAHLGGAADQHPHLPGAYLGKQTFLLPACAYDLEYTNNAVNAAGRRVRGFKGIKAILKLPMETKDGWQKVWQDDNPFEKT